MNLLHAAAGAAGLAAYALAEPYRFRLATHRLEVARPGLDLSVLHVSDTHMRALRHPRSARLHHFLRSLPSRLGTNPDVVVLTGDLIDGDEGIEPLIDAVGDLGRPERRFFVLGSHDYYLSDFQLYTKYLTKERRLPTRKVATHVLIQSLEDRGWRHLANARATVGADDAQLEVVGIDDPYLGHHDPSMIERSKGAKAAIGLLHTPELVSEWMLAGFDLVLAGHTHGGQVRLPRLGAMVTNCSLPNGLAAGPHRVGRGWLHVSPGLGTGRFSPIRFLCRPEATLLRLVSRPDD